MTFNGQSSVTIPAGETVTSDPVGMSVDALEYLTVSLFMKRTETMKTYGLIGGDTYIMSGNFAKAATTIGVPMKMEADFGEYSVIPALTGVEVYAPEASSAVVIGDSTLANDIRSSSQRSCRARGSPMWVSCSRRSRETAFWTTEQASSEWLTEKPWWTDLSGTP